MKNNKKHHKTGQWTSSFGAESSKEQLSNLRSDIGLEIGRKTLKQNKIIILVASATLILTCVITVIMIIQYFDRKPELRTKSVKSEHSYESEFKTPNISATKEDSEKIEISKPIIDTTNIHLIPLGVDTLKQ